MEPVWAKGSLFAGKYRVEAVLGRGGMGIVLGARHERLDEPVAIKVLLPELMESPRVVERFLREARAAAKIKSEHVVRVTDVDTLPSGVPYIVMERLEGVDLAALCRQRTKIGVEEAVDWVLQACDAVAEAHARGIVHRDLKPGNMFLAEREDGTCTLKVLDFGISKLASEEEHAVTDAGVALGSPSYMSPEQMRSAHDVDARTDIWALGVVLFRLLTGKTPFRADSLPQLFTLITGATLQKPSELRPDIPPGLEAVLCRCLEKEPARRYATVAELAEALLPFASAEARMPAPPASVRAITMTGRFSAPHLPAPHLDRLDVSGERRRTEAAAPCDRDAATSPEDPADVEADTSAPILTGADPARPNSESPASSMTPRPNFERRSTTRSAVIALGVMLLVSGAGIRIGHRIGVPVAAGAAAPAAVMPSPVTPATVTAEAPPPPPIEVTAAPEVTPAGSTVIASAAPITVVASAIANAPAAPKASAIAPHADSAEGTPKRKSPEKRGPAGPSAKDPFGGGRK